ncbi:MAG TPA: hypothetical protein VFX70_14050 [Mycobacteriales bacterium]|nr:hypothetical protein [Mycobacteriales bacterium]
MHRTMYRALVLCVVILAVFLAAAVTRQSVDVGVRVHSGCSASPQGDDDSGAAVAAARWHGASPLGGDDNNGG